jgi:hypothetical protein
MDETLPARRGRREFDRLPMSFERQARLRQDEIGMHKEANTMAKNESEERRG